MSHESLYYDLLEAIKNGECPICSVALRAVASWMDSVSYESVNDPQVRDSLRASYGFCNKHAYQWLDQRHLLGTAIIYSDVLEHINEDLQQLEYQRRDLITSVSTLITGKNIHEHHSKVPINSTKVCPACTVQAESEKIAREAFLEGLSEQEFRSTYEHSLGLCLIHLRSALQLAPNSKIFHFLKEHSIKQNDGLRKQLLEIIRKHDYRFRFEPITEERGADLRTIRHIAGEAGIRGLDLDKT
ncbi:hypothetical protein Tter_0616 [Thermobaculum terrenum ATCC BAA-798]|uniref:Uncharacterized protein n=1 Tax=Thermobaculum terrenum (strain ATCC BAA-798 / CCMEE 7001 / YNP1) TaxID=525904 RepID=D1CF28_THET1|nr:DUF6062 family protein [Thermobaculum terrenum]ACZ41534.1 hypothetical protein Tter_0616 [Thermobaculum terrenum ATCC BAA-798]